jgi:elongation factor P
MIDTGEIHRGTTIELEGKLYRIIDFQHIKLGRGSAQVRMKLRDLREGHTVERVVQAGTKFVLARLERRPMQYLYREGDLFYLMDQETFEQTPLPKAHLEEALPYLKEGQALELLIYKDRPVGVEMPAAVDLKVQDTGPAYKGDTAQSGRKPAKLETGLAIQVPLHISPGDLIKVDTRTGEYLEKAS